MDRAGRKRERQGERGSVLIIALAILIVVAGFTGALLTVAISGQTTSIVNEKKLTARGLAEGAVENAKQWLQTTWANQDGATIFTKAVDSVSDLESSANWTSLTISDYPARYALLSIPPWLFPAPTSASMVQLTPDGGGWYVDGTDGVRTIHYLYGVYGRAEYTPKQYEGDSKSIAAAITRVVEAQLTPLFQYAVFYNNDLEILPGPDMTLTGRVHSNRDMYLGCGATLKMDTNYVRAVGKIFRKRKDDGAPTPGTVLIKNLANLFDATPANDFQFKLPNGATTPSAMFSKAEMSALGISTVSGLDSVFGGKDTNADGDVDDSTDWKPFGTQAMTFWGGTVQCSDMDVAKAEPPQQGLTTEPFVAKAGGDYVQTSPGVYAPTTPGTGSYAKGFFNSKAGLAIVDGVPKSSGGVDVSACLLPGTISTASLYDAREGKMVPQTILNVGQLKLSLEQGSLSGAAATALAALKSSWNGLLYASSSGASPSTPKGILLSNGSELPNEPSTGNKIGLTVATNLPVYIQGDYNTKVNGASSATNDPAFHKPASVIGDAVNLLSNAWDNSKSSVSALPTASKTTFNTAMIAGNTNTVAGASYNGGLENLPRFHENWSGKNCTISGSFVNLWNSKIATGAWVYGSPKYTAPNRIWDFDPNFKDYAKLPPFTPIVVTMQEVCSQ
jgi:hypothetical protein